MKTVTLPVGYIPLVDAAPLIVAHELGHATDEGLSLDLRRAASWSQLRDQLAMGHVAAAHMLAPVPIAAALGLGGVMAPLSVLSVLSVNGTVIGVSRALADRLADAGHGFDFGDARAAGTALIAVARDGLRVGVPFPFSMHAELVYYWLSALGLPAPQALTVRTVPPPMMARALEHGEIDAFCVGEPWGSIAVERGVGALLLPGAAIWAFAPEKVLAARSAWIEEQPELCHRLIRAAWRAGRWLDDPDNRMLTAEIMGRPAYLDLDPEIVERSLSGRLVVRGDGSERQADQFMIFHASAATFPWRSQAEWVGTRLATRLGLDGDGASQAARAVFRSDLHRAALSATNADLPGASSKLEGSLGHDTAVASQRGRLILARDAFFDGRIFEPRGD